MYHDEANKRKAKLIMAFYWNAWFRPLYYIYIFVVVRVACTDYNSYYIEAHLRTLFVQPDNYLQAIICSEALRASALKLFTVANLHYQLSWRYQNYLELLTRAGFVTLSNSFKVVYVSHATSVIELFAFSGAVVVVISTDLGFTRSSFLREKACTLNGQKKKDRLLNKC